MADAPTESSNLIELPWGADRDAIRRACVLFGWQPPAERERPKAPPPVSLKEVLQRELEQLREGRPKPRGRPPKPKNVAAPVVELVARPKERDTAAHVTTPPAAPPEPRAPERHPAETGGHGVIQLPPRLPRPAPRMSAAETIAQIRADRALMLKSR